MAFVTVDVWISAWRDTKKRLENKSLLNPVRFQRIYWLSRAGLRIQPQTATSSSSVIYEWLVKTTWFRIVFNGRKRATLSDWVAAPMHSHESLAWGGKVSRAGRAAEWDVRQIWAAVRAGQGEDAKMSHGAISAAGGNAHLLWLGSSLSGRELTGHTLLSSHESNVLHVWKSCLSLLLPWLSQMTG